MNRTTFDFEGHFLLRSTYCLIRALETAQEWTDRALEAEAFKRMADSECVALQARVKELEERERTYAAALETLDKVEATFDAGYAACETDVVERLSNMAGGWIDEQGSNALEVAARDIAAGAHRALKKPEDR